MTTTGIHVSSWVKPMAEILRLGDIEFDEAVARTDAILRGGDLVIMPTDTVYGLVGDITAEAAEKIFALKGRDDSKPLPVLVGDIEQLRQVEAGMSLAGSLLADRYWPGPLTIVVYRHDGVPAQITAARDTIGVRMPDHPFPLALLQRHGGPLIATSANNSGEPAATSVSQLTEELIASVGLVLDGGDCPRRQASTVIDLTVTPPTVLREGPVTAEQLAKALCTQVQMAPDEQPATKALI